MRVWILVALLLGAPAAGLSALTLREFRALPDNRVAVRTSLGLREARPLDDRHVLLTLGLSVTDACENPDAYRVLSFGDPRYAYERFVRPTGVQVRHEPEAKAPAGCPFPRFERTAAVLTLPQPLRKGVAYHVVAQGTGGKLVTGAHTAQSFVYRPGAPSVRRDAAVDLAVLGLRRIEPVGPRLIRAEFGPAFAPTAGSDPSAYTVRVGGQPTEVTRLGRITRVDTYLPTGWPFAAIPLHEVYLELSQPFRNGDRIEVAVGASVTGGARSAALRYGDRKSLSGSLKVNQVGYLPHSPTKVGYLGRWMGSFPEGGSGAAQSANPSLLFAVPPTFQVCDAATGRVRFTGRARLVHRSGQPEGARRMDHSGENVYRLDFTRFRRPGRYFLSVPQVGRSLPFEIGEGIYRRAFTLQAAGLFEQRCGIALGPPYTTWRRIACHRGCIVPTTQSRLEPHAIEQLSDKVDRTRMPLRAYGGHHDAGDYNPRSHLDVAQVLMDAYEVAPRKFRDGQLRIPERGNGLPDILDEAFWALRLWIGLQDSDGGVFDGTESNGDPDFTQSVELDRLGDYAYAKDAAGSFSFAGAMAQAARIWRSLGRAREADGFLARARRAYDWALKHPPESTEPPAGYAPYLSPKAYAAAEMLHTTGEQRYRDDFAAACVWTARRNADLEVYNVYDQSRAAWAYARCPEGATDPALRKATRDAILRTVDAFIADSSTLAYSFLRHPFAPISWGTGAQLHWAMPAAWAYALTRDARYRDWILRSCDNTLGANPLGLSYIVGLGTRTVRAPLHNSRYSHLGEVVAGMQANGPMETGEGYRIQETAYPPLRQDFASLYTFADCHFSIAMDEGLSRSQAEAMALFGLLMPDLPRSAWNLHHQDTKTPRNTKGT